MVRLNGIAVVLTAFLVPFAVNMLTFVWLIIRSDQASCLKDDLLFFGDQLVFSVIFALCTFLAVRYLTQQKYKCLGLIAFLPILDLLCFHFYVCSAFKHFPVICGALPFKTIMLATVYLLVTLRVFIQWIIIAGRVRHLERLRQALSSPQTWLYAALLYIPPAVEFFVEIIIFPGVKDVVSWFGAVSSLLGPLAQFLNLYEDKLILAAIALYLITLVVYLTVFYLQQYDFQLGCHLTELVLLLCLLVIEQFLLLNPISLVITTVTFVLWHLVKSPSAGSYDVHASADQELLSFENHHLNSLDQNF